MYTNARYVKFFDGSIGLCVDINGVTWGIPSDPANTDYQNLMALVAAGELTIVPAEGA